MHAPLDDAALAQLFRDARTHYSWIDRPIADETLRDLYELLKWAPTSANSNPARFVFLKTLAARQRLVPALPAANVQKVLTAPAPAIAAFTLNFSENRPRVFPHNPPRKPLFKNSPKLVKITARR